MKRVKLLLSSLLLASHFCYAWQSPSPSILTQKTGQLANHCYLLIDHDSKECALVDVGGPVDSLTAAIDSQSLDLKYILVTHAHPDHIMGIKAVQNCYPTAQLVMHKQEYDDFEHYKQWETTYGPRLVTAWKQSAAMVDLMNFDYNSFSQPEISITEDTKLYLGNSEILILHTPGHSQGSLTFGYADAILVGDLLIYHADGFMEGCILCNKDHVNQSVLKLYRTFSDSTRILSGHGPFSTIGREKKENQLHSLQ
jgi:glyoxylase-like metal-dependent hydrolase (beta-lactamase superfamily II)